MKLDGRPVKLPGYAGDFSRADADKWAADQLREWKTRQRPLKEASGEKSLAKVAQAIQARKPAKRLPKKG